LHTYGKRLHSNQPPFYLWNLNGISTSQNNKKGKITVIVWPWFARIRSSPFSSKRLKRCLLSFATAWVENIPKELVGKYHKKSDTSMQLNLKKHNI